MLTNMKSRLLRPTKFVAYNQRRQGSLRWHTSVVSCLLSPQPHISKHHRAVQFQNCNYLLPHLSYQSRLSFHWNRGSQFARYHKLTETHPLIVNKPRIRAQENQIMSGVSNFLAKQKKADLADLAESFGLE